jgi:DNA polymerase phi
LTQCCEAFARASSDAPLSTLMDPNAVVDAVAAQFSVPGMPQKGVNALTRACTLVGKTAPEATPAEEPAAGGGGGEKKRDRAEGNKGGAKGGKKDAKKEKGDKKRKGESGGDKASKKKHKKK